MDVTSHMDGLYWGVVISTMLFGISMSQCWTYAHNNNDKLHLRLLVAVLILLDLTITCLNCLDLRYYLMLNFGNPNALLTINDTMMATFGVTLIVVYLSTLFYASRIYIFDRRSLWAAVIACCGSTGFLVNGALLLDGFRKNPQVSHLSSPRMKLWLGMALGSSLIGVTIITAVLMIKLSSARTHIKRTQTMLQRLLLFIVTRGVLVTLNLIAFLVVYEQSQNLNWIPFLFFTPKVHIISIVAMLNARTHPTNQLDENMITMTNIRSPDRTFNTFTTKSVDHSHSLDPQAMHLNSLSDGEQRHFNIQHPIPSFFPQADKVREPHLEISVEKSVQVSRC